MKRRELLQLSAAAGAGLIIQPALATTPKLSNSDKDGGNYRNVPEPVDMAPHKYTVTEIFGYTCPHCHDLEPSIHEWLKTKPENVHFQRMPAVFNSPAWQIMARVFYTSQELGVLDKSHNDFFDAIHGTSNRAKVPFSSVDDIAKYFTKYGVTEKQFTDTFQSFKVGTLVQTAAQRTRQFGVKGVPSIVVNGKYLTDVPMAKGESEMWNLVDKLLHI